MLAGLDEPDSGLVVKPSGLTIGYLPQDGLSARGRTLCEEAGLAFDDAAGMRAEITTLRSASATTRPRGGARSDADRYSELQDEFSAAKKATASTCRSRRCWAASASPPTISSGRPRPSPAAGRCGSRSPSSCSAGPVCCCSTNRRTTSISTRATGSRTTLELSARGHPRLARPLLPRRRVTRIADLELRTLTDYTGNYSDYLVERDAQMERLRQAEARTGRGSRADRSLHRPLPLSGDEGRAGAEPDQDARQGRAHRGAARAQARALHVSRVREERRSARSPRHIEGVRRGTSSSTASTC